MLLHAIIAIVLIYNTLAVFDNQPDHDPEIVVESNEAKKKTPEWYNALQGPKKNYYHLLYQQILNKSLHTSIPMHHRIVLGYETVPIDTQMKLVDINSYQHKILSQILSPFLSDHNNTIRMFEYNDKAAQSFIIFEIGNTKIDQWMQQIRHTFPYYKRFHPLRISSTGYEYYLQSKTGNNNLSLMYDEFDMIKSQWKTLCRTWKRLTKTCINVTDELNAKVSIRYLTNWIDVTQNKWLQKYAYNSHHDNTLSLSEIKDLIESQSIHTDAPYDITFTLFMTSSNYGDQLDYEQGMYFVVNNKKYLMKLHADKIMFTIFQSDIVHFTESVQVNEDEIVSNVYKEENRIWRLSSIMQTTLNCQVVNDFGFMYKLHQMIQASNIDDSE
eukprot:313792_1